MRDMLFALVLSFGALLTGSCSSSPTGDSVTSTGAGAAGAAGATTGAAGAAGATTGATGAATNCVPRCTAFAKACGQPSDLCAAQCGSFTEGQISCLEGAGCEAGDIKKCLEGGSAGTGAGGSGSGKFGEPCKCKPDTASGSGDFECSGTNVCSSGLVCVGTRTQGIDQGKCRGPVCCSGQADCATKLGQQSSCTSDQQCRCTFGDVECSGDNCNCASGFPGSRGLCYPKKVE